MLTKWLTTVGTNRLYRLPSQDLKNIENAECIGKIGVLFVLTY